MSMSKIIWREKVKVRAGQSSHSWHSAAGMTMDLAARSPNASKMTRQQLQTECREKRASRERKA